MAWRTDFTKTGILGKFRGLRTQLDNLPLILSMRSYHEVFFMVPLPKGTPRYLEGKDPSETQDYNYIPLSDKCSVQKKYLRFRSINCKSRCLSKEC